MRNLVTTRSRTEILEESLKQCDWLVGEGEDSWVLDIYRVPYSYLARELFTVNTTYDNVVPNFKHRMLSGEIIMNDYQNIKDSYWTPHGTLKIYHKIYGITQACRKVIGPITEVVPWSRVPWDEPNYSSSLDASASRSMIAALAKVNRAESQALVTIAELNKTVRMVRKTSSQIIHWFQMLRRLEKQYMKNEITLTALSSAYLQVRYGIRPLYYDIVGAMKAIAELGKPQRKVFHGYDSDFQTSGYLTDAVSPQNTASSGCGYLTVHHEWTKDRKVRSGVLVDWALDNKTLGQVFGLTQPLGTIWELIPFSFIIDWFFNTSNVIASLEPSIYADVIGSWTKVRENEVKRYDLSNVTLCRDAFAIDHWGSSNLYAQHSKTTTTRYANPTIDPIPSLDIRLDVGKIVDLIAIIFQLRSKLKFFELFDLRGR